MRKTVFATLLAVAAIAGCRSHRGAEVRADDTAKNQRDRGVVPTADNAGNSSADVDLTQKIRKAVIADRSLSTNAHNCKIVVQDGTVSLVGPVASDAEKSHIEDIAAAIAGDRKIVNELEVTN